MSNLSDVVRKVAINCSSSGNNTIIAAPSAGRIAIDHINVLPTDATTLTVYDGAGGTALSGPYPLDAKEPFVFENVMATYTGILTCSFGTAFVLNSTVATQLSGFVAYRIIDSY